MQKELNSIFINEKSNLLSIFINSIHINFFIQQIINSNIINSNVIINIYEK